MRTGAASDQPLGHERIAALDTSVVALPNIPQGTRLTVIRNLDQPIVWNDKRDPADGTDGMEQLKDEVLVYNGDATKFKLRTADGASGTADVRIAYYG